MKYPASLTLAAASLLVVGAAPAVAQVNSVALFGTVDLGGRVVRNGSLGTVKSMVSGSHGTSKLIFRATEDLGGGLGANIYLDSTLLADTGVVGASIPSGQFFDRRATISLTDRRLGELRAGRDWVPTHLLWSGFDPFGTLGVASANGLRSFAASRALGRAFGTGGEATAANPTLRVSNALEYWLPSGLAGVYGQAIVTAGEGGTTAAGSTRADGFRLGWSNKVWNVAAAQFTTRNVAAGGRFVDQAFGASADFERVKVDLQQRRFVYLNDRTTMTQAGVSVPIGLGTVKATWVRADQSGAATPALDANDAQLFGLGYTYAFSKRTIFYTHAARIVNHGAATFTIPGGAAVSANASAANYFGGQKSTGLELGMRHDF